MTSCPVISLDTRCGALLEIAEKSENFTLFSVSHAIMTMPDGRTLVTGRGTELRQQTTKNHRWIQCRLGHHIMDLKPMDVVKWD